MSQDFYVYNSFTDRAFEGNPAGVVPDADDLSTEQMHAMARQLNLVETVFICRPDHPDAFCKLRYFMPEGELPVAGHPTIAAWSYLLEAGLVDHRGTFIQESGAGNIRIKTDGDKVYASQKSATINVLNDFDWDAAYEIFNLQKDDIEPAYPTAMVDAGLGHIIFCVRSIASLMRMRFQPEALKAFCESYGARECQIFCRESYASDMTGHTRNLCPRYGLEDPACGNGSAALGAYYARFIAADTAQHRLIFEQGHVVQMPAVVEVLIDGADVMIGGHAVKMVKGTMTVR